MTEPNEGPDRAPQPVPEVQWLKARDTLLGAAPKGRAMTDGGEVEAEAALVLTGADEQLIVIEGSYRRLLKLLDYARSALVGSAQAMELVHEEGRAGLRCPHCETTVWEGDRSGLFVVHFAERYDNEGVQRRTDDEHGEWLEVGGGSTGPADWGIDHYECATCDRPVELPRSTRLVA